jgi:hypothetical protein
MSDRDDLAERLDAVEDDLGDSSKMFGPAIVYETPDGYETEDGEPVPTDDDGSPIPPDAPDGTSMIILDGRYAPRDGDGARGDDR